ncbi:MAG: hypothetical protein PHO10_04830 [Gemmiger sp.]|nr:hypothetical protein [Gemmiger sp.]
MDLSRRGGGRATRRRQVVLLLVLGCLAAGAWQLGPALAAYATALPGRACTALSTLVLPHYTARLAALEAENRTLHTATASLAGLKAENDALRTLAGSPQRALTRRYQPCTVVERRPGGVTVAGNFAVGSALLDANGRLAGVVTGHNRLGAVAALVGRPGAVVVGSTGENTGVLAYRGGVLYLDGLPRHSGAVAGDAVATAAGCPGGLWVGTLAGAPTPDETGLTASALLGDTANTAAPLLFVVEK